MAVGAGILSAPGFAHYPWLLSLAIPDYSPFSTPVSPTRSFTRSCTLSHLLHGLLPKYLPPDQWSILDFGDRVAVLHDLAAHRSCYRRDSKTRPDSSALTGGHTLPGQSDPLWLIRAILWLLLYPESFRNLSHTPFSPQRYLIFFVRNHRKVHRRFC